MSSRSGWIVELPSTIGSRCRREWVSPTFRAGPASVAQWIEHRFPKPCVAGSIPARGATKYLVDGLQVFSIDDASHLLAAGVNAKVVSERLGHSSVSFTLDTYGHVMPGQQSEAAEAAAALLRP